MITNLNLNPSIADQDEQLQALITKFKEIDEMLDEKFSEKATDEEIDAQVLLWDLTNDYHDGDGNWGWLNGDHPIFIQSGAFITLVIELDPTDRYTVIKAWYTDNWEDLEAFAQQF